MSFSSVSIAPSPLTILSDHQVHDLLENLTPAELESFIDSLAGALHDYSTNAQADENGTYGQPMRTSTYSRSTNATTLYMPSSGPDGMSVKVVTLPAPTPRKPRSSSVSIGSGGVTPPPPPIQTTGAITVFSPTGEPIGFLHARALTAFRTALASSCLVARRSRVQTLAVFGSGRQAYWHVRLALKLRGHTIRDVHIINRRFSDGARALLKTFYAVPLETRRAEGWENARFSLLTPGYNDYSRLLTEQVRGADVIFCCTPSTEDLFPADLLTANDARRKGRLVVAIGSYKPEMRELPDGLLRQAIRVGDGHRHHFHFHRHAGEGGVIVVDTLDGVMKEAGEIVQGGIEPHHLVELGELVMLHRLAKRDEDKDRESEEGDSVNTPTSENGDVTTPQSPDSPFMFQRLSSDEPRSSGGLRRFSVSTSSNISNNGSGSTLNLFAPVSPLSQAGSGLASGFKRRMSLHSRKSTRDSQSQDHTRNHSPTQSQESADSPVEKEKPKESKRNVSSSRRHKRSKSSRNDTMARWLEEGNVIYKSVGFGLMDLVVSTQVVKVAAEKGIGCQIQGFSER